jgi:hypothetical protein
VNRFGTTGLVPVAVDRTVDPYTHIDRVRGEVYDLIARQQALELELQALKNAEADRVTQSGVWTIVKGKIDEEVVRWVRWGIRAGLVGLWGTILTGIGWLIKRAFFP